MAYQVAATAVTLNDLESPVAGLFKCNPSNMYESEGYRQENNLC